jgi:adenosylmethionine-8-amino-7-oxononanoate aminotransferase
VEAARHRGLLVYPAALGINGYSGDAIVVAPPLIVTDAEIRELVTRLREALLDVSRGLNEGSSSEVSVQDSKSREKE